MNEKEKEIFENYMRNGEYDKALAYERDCEQYAPVKWLDPPREEMKRAEVRNYNDSRRKHTLDTVLFKRPDLQILLAFSPEQCKAALRFILEDFDKIQERNKREEREQHIDISYIPDTINEDNKDNVLYIIRNIRAGITYKWDKADNIAEGRNRNRKG